jgi:hypothetical protein
VTTKSQEGQEAGRWRRAEADQGVAEQRFLDWYVSLPEFARNCRFSMSEFEVRI